MPRVNETFTLTDVRATHHHIVPSTMYIKDPSTKIVITIISLKDTRPLSGISSIPLHFVIYALDSFEILAQYHSFNSFLRVQLQDNTGGLQLKLPFQC